jgi:hypothetical protein
LINDEKLLLNHPALAWGILNRSNPVPFVPTGVTVGAEMPISAEIENSSSNIIYIGESRPETDFRATLTSGTGKVYTLTPPDAVSTYNTLRPLNPGASASWTIHVGVNRYYAPPGLIPTDRDIESLTYTLNVARTFIEKDRAYKLESNSLKIQIK